jgi:Zn-dependent protease with chaperone function
MSSRPSGSDALQAREDFLAAAARCRRAVWRVGTVAVLCSAFLLAVLAALFTPLTLVVLVLTADLVNLAVPTPEPLALVGQWARTFPEDQRVTAFWTALVGVPFLVTLVAMALAYWRIGRALALSPPFSGVFDADDLGLPGARRPDGTVLAEQRIVNTVEEMAVAAGLPAPSVRIVDGGANVAIVGLDERHMLVLAGTGLAALSRDELQGASAQLLASAANGDLGVGREVARMLVLVTVFRVGGRVFQPGGAMQTARLCRALFFPTRTRCRELVSLTAVPPPPPPTPRVAGPRRRRTSLKLSEWLVMPLAGPLALAGVLGDLLLDFVVLPLVALAWRQRKYMADATAVRLTRYPDALAGALKQMDHAASNSLPAWLNHLAVVDRWAPVEVPAAENRIEASLQQAEARSQELFRSSLVSVFPPLRARLAALVRMGASADLIRTARTADSGRPLWVWIVAGPLLAVAVALMPVLAGLLALSSLLVSGVFTLFPGFVLHFLLRL